MNFYTYPSIKGSFQAHIHLPGSKSMTNRALLLAAIAHGNSTLYGILNCEDTLAMRGALRSLGLSHSDLVPADDDILKIRGMNGLVRSKRAIIDCTDAGTVLRFILPVCALQPGIFSFQGSAQLTKRPIKPLMQVLSKLGAEFEYLKSSDQLPFMVKGSPATPTTNTCFVPSDVSSQFLSGLLMAAPLSGQEMWLYTQNSVSEPYIHMTCRMMSQFGVTVEQAEEHLFRVLPQRYEGIDYYIEPDLSTASYFFAAAALTESTITIPKIDRHHPLQGDVFFLNILERMGCTIRDSKKGVTVVGCQTRNGIHVDLKGCSDLFMTVACLSVFSKAPSIITGIQHIRAKESDRIQATKENLARVGITLLEHSSGDAVTIIPGLPHAAVLESYDDHRIVMAFALLGLKVPGISMRNTDCVSKTCPDFEALWEKMLKSAG